MTEPQAAFLRHCGGLNSEATLRIMEQKVGGITPAAREDEHDCDHQPA